MEQAEDADYASVYGVFDPTGRRLASDEHPGVRAARGERFKNVPVDWVTPRAGARSSSRRTPSRSARRAKWRSSPSRTSPSSRPPAAARRCWPRRPRTRQLAGPGRGRPVGGGPHRSRRSPTGVSSSCCSPTGRWPATRSRRPTRPTMPMAAEYMELYPLDMDSPVGSPQVIRSGEPQLIAELPPDFVDLAAPDPRQREVLEGIGFTSMMIVPLRARGRVIGDLALAMAQAEPPLRRGGPGRRAAARGPLRARARQRAALHRAQRGRSRPRTRPATRSTRSSATSPTP